jgi:hypothetical protein
MDRNTYINRITDLPNEPNDLSYLTYAVSIAQIDNNIAKENISSSIGGWKDGITIDETFYNENVSSNNKPSWTDVNSIISELKTAYVNKQYKRNRAKEYPSIQEQLDMQYWDSVNGTTTWQDKINEIKTKYPKG